MLIDEGTTDEVAHLIASRLFAPSAGRVPGLALNNSYQSAASLDSLESAPVRPLLPPRISPCALSVISRPRQPLLTCCVCTTQDGHHAHLRGHSSEVPACLQPSPLPHAHKPLSRGRKIGANMRRLFSKVMRTSTPRQRAVPVDPSTPSTCSRSDRTELEPESDASTATEVWPAPTPASRRATCHARGPPSPAVQLCLNHRQQRTLPHSGALSCFTGSCMSIAACVRPALARLHDGAPPPPAATGGALPRRHAGCVQVLGRVSEDLALSILHAAPNVFTLLATLPPKLHPLAMRAQHPSMDSHHSLIFHFRDIAAAVPAARAAASVPHLTSLAFHAVRTPHCPLAPQAPADAAAVFRAVADMPRLSSFTLKGWILDLDGELNLSRHLRQPGFGGGRLRHLGLSHLRAAMTVVPPALAPFAGTLTSLDLSHTHLTAAAAHTLSLYVGDLRELRQLLIGCTHLGDVGWAALAPQIGRLTALEHLDVSSVHISADKFFVPVPGVVTCPGGESASESASESSGVVAFEGDGGLEGEVVAGPVIPIWTWLQSLDVSHNRQLRHVPDLGARLACMTSMRRLNCAGMGLFGDHAVDALRVMSKLQLVAVDWSYNDLSKGAAQLSACLEGGWRGLTALTLTRSEIRCGAAEMLAESLVCLQELQELHLQRNGLAKRGTVALAPAVGELRALRVLNLAQNELGDVGAHAISQHAAGLAHLEALDLSSNGVRGLGAAAAVDAAAALPHLRLLALDGNAVGEDGVAEVVAALGRCTRGATGSVGGHGVAPCSFRLRGNGFGASEVSMLCAAAPAGVSLDLQET